MPERVAVRSAPEGHPGGASRRGIPGGVRSVLDGRPVQARVVRRMDGRTVADVVVVGTGRPPRAGTGCSSGGLGRDEGRRRARLRYLVGHVARASWRTIFGVPSITSMVFFGTVKPVARADVDNVVVAISGYPEACTVASSLQWVVAHRESRPVSFPSRRSRPGRMSESSAVSASMPLDSCVSSGIDLPCGERDADGNAGVESDPEERATARLVR